MAARARRGDGALRGAAAARARRTAGGAAAVRRALLQAARGEPRSLPDLEPGGRRGGRRRIARRRRRAPADRGARGPVRRGGGERCAEVDRRRRGRRAARRSRRRRSTRRCSRICRASGRSARPIRSRRRPTSRCTRTSRSRRRSSCAPRTSRCASRAGCGRSCGSRSSAACSATSPPPAPGAPARLDISGPFSLFRHTLVYGRALAELLPHLAWCARFELAATARLRGRLAQVTMFSGDPIFPARAPALFDSRLEERFARDVARLAPDWDVIREPLPLQAGASLIFPDFLVRHRIHPRAAGAGRDRRLLDARVPDREARPAAPGGAARVRALHRRGAGVRAVRAAARPAGGDVPPPRRRRRGDARGGAAHGGRGTRCAAAIVRMTARRRVHSVQAMAFTPWRPSRSF